MIHALVLALLTTPVPAVPQDSCTFFDRIVGEWRGEGRLFGQPARFEMIWEWELDRRFVRLTFAIRGNVAMDAVAHYRLGATGPLDGVWLDTRGELLQLQATLTDAMLETRWRSPTEQGRTTYELTGADSVTVRDYVLADTDSRLFGEARYTRVSAARPPAGCSGRP